VCRNNRQAKYKLGDARNANYFIYPEKGPEQGVEKFNMQKNVCFFIEM
jgi:hypothetical protein